MFTFIQNPIAKKIETRKKFLIHRPALHGLPKANNIRDHCNIYSHFLHLLHFSLLRNYTFSHLFHFFTLLGTLLEKWQTRDRDVHFASLSIFGFAISAKSVVVLMQAFNNKKTAPKTLHIVVPVSRHLLL